MKKICNAANQKLSALSRMLELTIPTQSKKLINYFINAQFTSCPLIWCSLQRSTVNQLIKYMRSLRLVFKDYESSFDILLSTLNEKNDSSTLYKRFTNRSIQICKRLLPRFNE